MSRPLCLLYAFPSRGGQAEKVAEVLRAVEAKEIAAKASTGDCDPIKERLARVQMCWLLRRNACVNLAHESAAALREREESLLAQVNERIERGEGERNNIWGVHSFCMVEPALVGARTTAPATATATSRLR